MKNIVAGTKQIGLLTIALTVAFGANLAYGQWTNPTAVPPANNAETPINTSATNQIKTGSLGVDELIAAGQIRSDQYCAFDGTNCFVPDGSMAGVPSGAVTAFYSLTCPVGWVEANGANGTPDLRGTFVRGLNGNQNGREGARSLGQFQNDAFQSHSHTIQLGSNTKYGPDSWGVQHSDHRGGNWGSYRSRYTGAGETRPMNVTLLYCMKV